MKRIGGVLGALGIVGWVAGCQPKAETPEATMARHQAEQQAAEKSIGGLLERFMVHYNSGHADSVAAFYAQDGHILAPNAPAIVGRAAILAMLAEELAAKPQIKLVTKMVSAGDDLAVERGTYEVTFTPPGIKVATTDRGKYLVRWQRIGGQWLIADEIFNTDLPPAPVTAPAPPRRGKKP